MLSQAMRVSGFQIPEERILPVVWNPDQILELKISWHDNSIESFLLKKDLEIDPLIVPKNAE